MEITDDMREVLNYSDLSSCDESDEREFNELVGLNNQPDKTKPTLNNQPKRSSSTLTD